VGCFNVCERAMFMGFEGVEREHVLCIHVTQSIDELQAPVDTVMNPSVIKMRKKSYLISIHCFLKNACSMTPCS
jgi:hypothetical protein